jgi:hypothetical protein
MSLVLCRIEKIPQRRHSSWSERLWVNMETAHRKQTREKKVREWSAPVPGVGHCGRNGRRSLLQGGKGEGKNPTWYRSLHPTEKDFK